ncbi:hypothetical protein JW835_09355 [bacterium]|nr:hypothetical protein [bacterium]
MKHTSIFIILLSISMTLRAQEWQHYTKTNSGLPGNDILSIAVSPSGEDIWFGLGYEEMEIGQGSGGRGLARYHMSADTWEAFNFQDGLISDIVEKVFVGSRHVWFYTDKGPMMYDLANQTFHQVSGIGSVRDFVSNDTTAWFATGSGLKQYHFNRKTLINITTEQGLISNSVNCLSMEGDQLWIGTECGLQIYNISTLLFANAFFEELESADIQTVCTDAFYVWVACQDGLHRKDRKTGIWDVYLQGKELRTMTSGRNRIYVVISGEGIKEYDYSQHKWQSVSTSGSGLNSASIDEIGATPWGLWVGTGNGAWHYRPCENPWSNWDGSDIGMSAFLNTVGADNQYVWVGGADGISRYNKQDQKWDYFNVGEVTDLEVGSKGVVFGGPDGRIKTMNKESGEIISSVPLDPSFNKPIEDIELDGNEIWVASFFATYKVVGHSVIEYDFEDYLIWGNGPASEGCSALAVGEEYIWFGPTENLFEGFPRYERATGQWKNDITGFDAIISEIQSVAVYDDFVWYGSLGIEQDPGLHVLNKHTLEWDREFIQGDLFYQTIWAITPDPFRNQIWFGCSSGVVQYDFNSREWNEYNDDTALLITNDVQDIAADQNAVWFVTGGSGIAGKEGGVTRYGDNYPPMIIHAPQSESHPVNQSIHIEAEMVDNLLIVRPILHYQRTGQSTFNEIPMTYQFGDVWAASIPAGDVKTEGVLYYLSVSDGSREGYHPWMYPSSPAHQIPVYDDIPPEGSVELMPLSDFAYITDQDTLRLTGSVDGTESIPVIESIFFVEYNSLGILIAEDTLSADSLNLAGTDTHKTFDYTFKAPDFHSGVSAVEVQMTVSESDSVEDLTFSSNRISVIVDEDIPLGFISFPGDQAEVEASVRVMGTAYDLHMKEYRLEYAAGESPAAWRPILITDPNQTVVNNVLGQWYTVDLPDSVYSLRLSVFDLVNRVTRDTVLVHVQKQAPLPIATLISPQDSLYVNGLVPVRGYAAGESFASASLRLTGTDLDSVVFTGIQKMENELITLLNTASFPDGSCELILSVANEKDEVESDTVSLIIDNTPPTAALTSPGQDTINCEVLLEGVAEDVNLKHMNLKYASIHQTDTSKFIPLSDHFGFWMTLPLDGWHTVYLTVEDQGGLVSTDQKNYYIHNPSFDMTSGFKKRWGQHELLIPPNGYASSSICLIHLYMEDFDFQTGAFHPTDCIFELRSDKVDLTLKKPGVLQLSFSGLDINQADKESLALFYWDEPEWEFAGGTVNPSEEVIIAPVSKLGIYGVFVNLDESVSADEEWNIDCQPRVFSPGGGGYDTQTAVSFSLKKSMDVTVKVYNLSGRLKKCVLESRNMNPGMNVVHWDGRDGNGAVVPGGLYIVTVKTDSKVMKKTVSVVNR